MFRLGERQTLEIVKEVEFGVYLATETNAPSEERVLLPAKQVQQQIHVTYGLLDIHHILPLASG